MAKTVVGLFDTFAEAQRVVQSLIDTGVDRNNISLVANDASGAHAAYTQETGVETSTAAESAGAGAVGGSVIGGVLGLLVGVGALAIPGIGPVITAGTLATTLGSTALGAGIGAAAGGLVGALVGAGVPEEDANVYSEGVRRGGTLVTVNAADDLAENVYAVMNQHGAVDIKERGTNYREGGWDRFDPASAPYAADKDGNEWERSSKVGTAGGTAAGAATGAAMGSVAGPVGTVIGGLAGAAVGAGVGAAGDVAGREADDSDGDAGELDDPARPRSAVAYDAGTAARDAGDTVRGTADHAENDWERSSKVGTAGGTAAGAATGAAMGSVAGPVGTVVGGLAVGASAGAAGDAAGRHADDQDGDVGELDDPTRPGMRTTTSGTGIGSDRTTPGNMETDWERSSKVGTAGGTAAGAATGAAIGSVAGPIGTVVGGLAGAAVGAGAGAAGDAAGRYADDQDGEAGKLDDPSRPRMSSSSSTPIQDATVNMGSRVDAAGDTVRGAADHAENDWERSSKAGTAGGTAAGAATGAAMGSVAGPVGTVVGGLAGAAVGAATGAAGDAAGRHADDQDGDVGELDDPTRPSMRTTTSSTTTNPSNTSGFIPASTSGEMDRNDMQAMEDTSLTGARDVSDTYKSETEGDWEESAKLGTGTDAAAGTATGSTIGAAGGAPDNLLGTEPMRQRDEGGVQDFDSYDADFRTDYQENYATSGYAYDQYNQVYRYGYSLGADQRYRNSEWDAIEREAHRAWDERNPGTWDQFKGAIQYAWAKARGHMA